MEIKSVAIISGDFDQSASVGVCCERALSRRIRTKLFRPTELNELEQEEFELYLYVDDGQSKMPLVKRHPRVCWVTCAESASDWRLGGAALFDYIFCAQSSVAELLRSEGRPSEWLPFGIDPGLYQKAVTSKVWDICFLGRMEAELRRLAEIIRRHVPNNGIKLHSFNAEVAAYSSSRILFNRSTKGDLNRYVFEALASGTFLLTDELTREAGQSALFRDGVHLATYMNPQDMLRKIIYYLKREDVRERIAANGRSEVLSKHTYARRVERLLSAVSQFRRDSRPIQLTTVSTADDKRVLGSGSEETSAVDWEGHLCGSASRILDFACGSGVQWETVKPQKRHITGVTNNAACAELAERRLDLVLVGSPEKIKAELAMRTYDRILLRDILGTLRNPVNFLRNCRRWLSPEGLIFAELQNIGYYPRLVALLGGDNPSDGLAIDAETDTLYTYLGVRTMFANAGYEICCTRICPDNQIRAEPKGLTSALEAAGVLHASNPTFPLARGFLVSARPRIQADQLISVLIIVNDASKCILGALDHVIETTDGVLEFVLVATPCFQRGTEIAGRIGAAVVRLIDASASCTFPDQVRIGMAECRAPIILLYDPCISLFDGWIFPMRDVLSCDNGIVIAAAHIRGRWKTELECEGQEKSKRTASLDDSDIPGIYHEAPTLSCSCVLVRRSVVNDIEIARSEAAENIMRSSMRAYGIRARRGRSVVFEDVILTNVDFEKPSRKGK